MILALPVPYFEARGFGAYSTQQIQQMIVAQAQADGVPPAIALGVAAHESQFTPTAVNPSSQAAGLFQLMPITQQTLGVSDPLDPSQNIDAGVGLLATYYQKYGNWNTALQAYAGGPGSLSSPPTQEAQGLISFVDSYSPPSGLDLSSGDSSASTLDLSSLGLPDFSLTLPDLTQSTLIPGVPDWLTWLGAAGTVVAAVILVNR